MTGNDVSESYSVGTILRGISHALFVRLAMFDVLTMQEIIERLPKLSYGDRATLQAYGVIIMGPETRRGPREISWVDRPLLASVVGAASDIVETVLRRNQDQVQELMARYL